jgi:hypothetical protein
MERQAIAAFLARGWGAAEALERDHWAREFAERGPEATFAASQALWRHMRSVRPDWPSDVDLQADLDHHVHLKRAIDRAARVFSALSAR